MEVYWILVTIFVICLPMQCLTASLQRVADDNDETKEEFGAEEAGFAPSGNQRNFQSWSDWLSKRSFGEFPFGDKHLQAWKEWMEKRSLLQGGSAPRFGASNNFQQWKDWMNKRGGGMLPSNDAGFQSWNEWMKKRGLGGNPGSTFGQPSGGNFQSWGDFTKRGLGGNPGSTFGQPSGGNFQSWGDFTKRANLDSALSWNDMYKKNFGFVKPSNPFSVRFGSNPNLMKWDDMIKRSHNKRQLGNSPSGFGNSKQYFTNGLQDWRYTFKNSKRAASSAKNTKHESN